MVGWDIFSIKNPAIFADGGENRIKYIKKMKYIQ